MPYAVFQGGRRRRQRFWPRRLAALAVLAVIVMAVVEVLGGGGGGAHHPAPGVTDRVPEGGKVLITKQALHYQGSGVGLLPRGKRIAVDTMLTGLLLPSGNDAAIALAQRAGGGRVSPFVAQMNARAKRMGLLCTHYTTPSGFLDRGNHSCASDLAALARAILRVPRLARIVRRRQAVLPFPVKGGKLYLYNSNPLLRMGYRGVTGLKTGF